MSVGDRVHERRRAAALARHYRDEEGLSIGEIARRLGRADATVKAYLYDPSDASKRPTDSPQERQFWALAGHAHASRSSALAATARGRRSRLPDLSGSGSRRPRRPLRNGGCFRGGPAASDRPTAAPPLLGGAGVRTGRRRALPARPLRESAQRPHRLLLAEAKQSPCPGLARLGEAGRGGHVQWRQLRYSSARSAPASRFRPRSMGRARLRVVGRCSPVGSPPPALLRVPSGHLVEVF